MMVPSTISSSTPVTVTVCGVSQFIGVKVRVPVVVLSLASLEPIETTTSDVG